MRITRRHLQVSLAVLWLLDGALQCQPYMFHRSFADGVLAPAGMGQPTLIAAMVHWAAAGVSVAPALANSGFALIQLGIGVGLLTRRFARPALTASVVWALSIWVVGEGLGGLASGSTLLAGAPGAALLYAVVAYLAWPSRLDGDDARPSWLALPAWCALWLSGALLQFVAGNNSASSFTMMLHTAQASAPGWIASIDRVLLEQRVPSWTAAAAIAVYVLVAVWSAVPGWTRRWSVGVGVIVTVTGWLLIQGLGDLSSGRATDPNSGPLVVLMALAVLGARPPRTATTTVGTAIGLELAPFGSASTLGGGVRSPNVLEVSVP